jgi:CHAT domain-containing protein
VFAPIVANLLDGINASRLLVLPDGPLNGMPFAALPLPHGAPRETLIDRYVLTAAPSLALALRPPPHRDPVPTRVAVISDPVYTPDDRRLSISMTTANYRGGEDLGDRLARLPYSAIEARAVARAFDGSEFAADGSPLAADRLTADDIARSGLRADVVVLSGCATGDGGELRGEGVLGLTYGFLANGSQTVVASLWPVEDALTARFMEEFYTAYRASGRAADALRTAQLKTRGSDTAAVWSSFVVRSNGLP